MVIKDAESYSKSITGAKERKSNIGVDIGYHNSNAEVILYFLAEPGDIMNMGIGKTFKPLINNIITSKFFSA